VALPLMGAFQSSHLIGLFRDETAPLSDAMRTELPAASGGRPDATGLVLLRSRQHAKSAAD